MFKVNLKVPKLSILCIIVVLLLVFFTGIAKAQSINSLNSRVLRLESENNQLKSRISRLESEINQAQRNNSPVTNKPLSLPNTEPIPSVNDPMFDRLATLVIELKERVNALEKRMDELEKPISMP